MDVKKWKTRIGGLPSASGITEFILNPIAAQLLTHNRFLQVRQDVFSSPLEPPLFSTTLISASSLASFFPSFIRSLKHPNPL